jgi:hypothetical protein
MVLIKETNYNKCWQGYGKKGMLSSATMEISIEVPQKTKTKQNYDSAKPLQA